MGALSPTHWVIVIAAFALLFGAKKLPEAARGVGQAMRIFKAETSQLNNDRRAAAESDERKAVGEPTQPTPPPQAAPPDRGDQIGPEDRMGRA